ncbi:DUF2922 family protein [Lacticaseibacillus nasuensis]|uniref:DUF2922 family protein n=1 Tax=Lacticaseibacillus nasuensis TaxID=944671 RepID=UPI0022473B2D|nr:DUF2922 family protein [Lacticaseibacillus nasuensis]MCX2454617.1 DUF2922 family protein [Lacticaseibacillus nasuensis]
MQTLQLIFTDTNGGRRVLSLARAEAPDADVIRQAMQAIADTKLFKKDDNVIYATPVAANGVVTQTHALYLA